MSRASEWLKTYLTEQGQTLSRTLKDQAKEAGYTELELTEARQSLNVIVDRVPGTRSTMWSLPSGETEPPPLAPHVPILEEMEADQRSSMTIEMGDPLDDVGDLDISDVPVDLPPPPEKPPAPTEDPPKTWDGTTWLPPGMEAPSNRKSSLTENYVPPAQPANFCPNCGHKLTGPVATDGPVAEDPEDLALEAMAAYQRGEEAYRAALSRTNCPVCDRPLVRDTRGGIPPFCPEHGRII